MKIKTTCLFFLFSLSLFAQEPYPNSTSGKGASPINQKPGTKNQEPSTYAVVVGISDYQDEGIPDLRFANKDAEAFAHFLRSPAGGSLDGDHLKLLTNEQATGAQIFTALDWLIDVVKESDRVIIYFSGHGDVEAKRISQPGYLLGWDAPSRVYAAGGTINIRDFQDYISTLSVYNKGKVMVITDACRSGKLSGNEINGAQLTSQNLAKQFENEIKILSCQPNEYSIEGDQWGGGRGVFSYHLLDGLYGIADGNDDLSVNLLEIGRYLEDKVSSEVAPQNQLPMTVGNGRENLFAVFPEVLEQLREGKKGQLALFTPTESRGIEADVLAAADTNIVEMYAAFQQTIKDKQFLEPATACTDFYYEKLSKEPQLERLHSSMKRNYAAALQDDAQQVMNTMLKSGLTEVVLKNTRAADIWKNYPAYLQRAAELLGEQHYMSPILQARKLFFEGEIAQKAADGCAFYRQALNRQPDMAHAMVGIIRNAEADQLDSVEYFFQQSTELIPAWVEPYVAMAVFYKNKLKHSEKAEEMLNLAGQTDSTSVLVWYNKANLYARNKKYELAEKWFLKTIEGTGEDICFPCAYINLGLFYIRTDRFDKGEKYIKKAIQLDSASVAAHRSLGWCYLNARRFDEAENQLIKAIQLDSTSAEIQNNLGSVYLRTGRFNKAEKYFKKAIQLDSTYTWAYYNLGWCYLEQHRYEESEFNFKKAIELAPDYAWSYTMLGWVYKGAGRYGDSEIFHKKAIQIDSSFWEAYVNLAILYQFIQRWEESIPIMEKAISIKPDGVLYAILGNAYTHLPKHFANAKPLLEKAIEMTPDHPDSYYYFAQYALQNKQYDRAWDYLNMGLKKGLGERDIKYDDLNIIPDFEEMRKTSKWRELMKNYFPDNFKD